jgi:hypothetical protein
MPFEIPYVFSLVVTIFEKRKKRCRSRFAAGSTDNTTSGAIVRAPREIRRSSSSPSAMAEE